MIALGLLDFEYFSHPQKVAQKSVAGLHQEKYSIVCLKSISADKLEENLKLCVPCFLPLMIFPTILDTSVMNYIQFDLQSNISLKMERKKRNIFLLLLAFGLTK